MTLEVETCKNVLLEHYPFLILVNTPKFAPVCRFAILCHTAKRIFQTEFFSPLNTQNG